MKQAEQIRLSLKSVKKQVDNLAVDQATKLGLKVVFLSLGLSFIWLAVFWSKLPPEVPLLYSRPYGEARLVNHWALWSLPLLSLVLSLISIRKAGELIEKDRLLGQMLVWFASLTTVMVLIALIKIVVLVT